MTESIDRLKKIIYELRNTNHDLREEIVRLKDQLMMFEEYPTPEVDEERLTVMAEYGLTLSESHLFMRLKLNKGATATRDVLWRYLEVNGGTSEESDPYYSLTQHVKRLRKKVGLDWVISSVYGEGYQMRPRELGDTLTNHPRAEVMYGGGYGRRKDEKDV